MMLINVTMIITIYVTQAIYPTVQQVMELIQLTLHMRLLMIIILRYSKIMVPLIATIQEMKTGATSHTIKIIIFVEPLMDKLAII
jgi:hypothetical protein